MGYQPWGRTELDTTERLTHTHTHTRKAFLGGPVVKNPPSRARNTASVPGHEWD